MQEFKFYIRGKSRKNSCQEIHEEEEEQDAANIRGETANIEHKQPSEGQAESLTASNESKETKGK